VVVPEPTSLVLLAIGGLGGVLLPYRLLGGGRRRAA
jgi:PEP-CTERM motif